MSAARPVIHVVVDDASFRRGVARLLGAAGYQVALYESGDHAERGGGWRHCPNFSFSPPIISRTPVYQGKP